VNELLERLRAAWDNLSVRERMILSVLGVMVTGTLLFAAIVNPILSASASASERVDAAENDLDVMTRLRREYESVNARLVGVEQRIRENQDQQNTLTLIESLASGAAVKIDSMEERKSPDHELYRETRVEVSLKNVTLTQVVNLLHRIEASPRQFSVKGLRIKTRKQNDADTLEVAFTVSSFETI
jgi:type II secretory pathway component PulM